MLLFIEMLYWILVYFCLLPGIIISTFLLVKLVKYSILFVCLVACTTIIGEIKMINTQRKILE